MDRLMQMAAMQPDMIRQFGMEPERFMEMASMMQGGANPSSRDNAFDDPNSMMEALGGLGNLPMPEFGEAVAVRKEALARSTAIFKHYRILRDLLDRHEATIQKRWLKKGKEQRRKTIAAAWGRKMASTHRPDFQAFRNEGTVPQGSSKHRDAYMWPFINEEDLTRPRTMLHFLNARGRTPPSAFAASDLEAMHFGIVAKAIVPLFLNEHVMLFHDGDTPDTYGRLINWDDHEDAFDWFHTRKEMQPGEGLLILESQEKTLEFLVNCAMMTLHDVASPLKSPVQPAPPRIVEPDSGMSSLAAMSAEASYRPPANISFARIETLLGAARDAASDHLWALREDPGYFASCIFDAKEHRQEMMKDTRGLDHPLFRAGKEDVVWARSVNRVVADAHLALELWASLHQQAIELGRMKSKYEGEIDPKKHLATPYLNALLRFQHYLHRAADLPLGGLKMAHAASPPLRHLYRRKPEDNPMASTTSYGVSPNANPDEKIKRLTWLFRTLAEDDNNDTLFLTGLSRTVDELQRMMDSEAAVKPLVSSNLAAYISDLSIVAECLRQVEIYQPWANTFEHFAAERKEEIDEEYTNTSEPWVRILQTLKKSEIALGRHADLSNGRFHYPVEKRTTKENVEALQSAEQALDYFWLKVDELLHLNIKSLDGLAVKELLGSRKLQRTPDWVEPKKGEVKDGVEDIVKPLSEIYFDLERRTERTQHVLEEKKGAKSKIKTRGVAAVAETPNEIPETSAEEEPRPVFEVDARALRVFKTLFYTPSSTGTPGEVAWLDFLHALVSIGFQAEKLYGSVWQFVPNSKFFGVERRSIHFHEPHPGGKMAFWVARRCGRRLERAFGWGGETFVLKEKR